MYFYYLGLVDIVVVEQVGIVVEVLEQVGIVAVVVVRCIEVLVLVDHQLGASIGWLVPVEMMVASMIVQHLFHIPSYR